MEKDIEIVSETGSGERALELIDQLNPDVVLLDERMPDMKGSEVCQRALAENPGISVVILSAFSKDDDVLPCIRAGADAYVLKDVDVTELVRTIRAVHGGETVLDPELVDTLMKGLRHDEQQPGVSLTKRETRITELIAEGLTNQEIGEQLCLSTSMVKVHIRDIMEKLEVSRRAALVYEASKKGLI